MKGIKMEILCRKWYCGTGGGQFFGVIKKTSKMMVIQALEKRYITYDPPYNQQGKEFPSDKFNEKAKPFRVKIGKYEEWDGQGVEFYPD
jgi:hypothetical protein